MKHVAHPLLLMHADPVFRARILDAARNDFSVEEVPTWDVLRSTLQQLPPAAVVVVDPYLPPGGTDSLAPELQRLLQDYSSVTVVAALRVQPARIADVRTLGEWGIAEVVSEGEDSVGAIGAVLRSARGKSLRRLLEQAVPDLVSTRARSILRAAADVTAIWGKATDLARRLYVSMRTLNRWCESEGLPPPRQLLAWMRILLAATLLDDRGRSVEDVAWACGYSADSGLRRALRDFLGVSPKVLRKDGAFSTAFDAFLHALEPTI